MATYKTPDVYVEEISLFPPSVAEVETAVPAFIGYTEKAKTNAVSLTMKPTKIDSMIEFQQYFSIVDGDIDPQWGAFVRADVAVQPLGSSDSALIQAARAVVRRADPVPTDRVVARLEC